MSSPASGKPGRGSCEKGFLLVFLCPLLLVGLLFLAGSVEVIRRSQAKVALQSRLDVCAVELAVGRQKLFRSLTSTNRWMRITATGIAMARGAMLLTGPVGAMLSGMGMRAMMLLNRALALEQQIEIAAATGKEALRLICRSNQFSREMASCWASPPLLSHLIREKTLFPDVNGPIVFRKSGRDLSLVRCMALSARTEIRIEGDPTLTKKGWEESYAQ